ncbi:Uncharacterised protein [Staphylococcus petrasii]|nr:Uncharacterised protein [Staphylococcus petrasii]
MKKVRLKLIQRQIQQKQALILQVIKKCLLRNIKIARVMLQLLKVTHQQVNLTKILIVIKQVHLMRTKNQILRTPQKVIKRIRLRAKTNNQKVKNQHQVQNIKTLNQLKILKVKMITSHQALQKMKRIKKQIHLK